LRKVPAQGDQTRLQALLRVVMDIHQVIATLSPIWHGLPPASDADLDAIERHRRIALPADYRALMRWSNGGEAKLAKVYLSLWLADKIVALNDGYKIQSYLGDQLLAIGSDGGPICFMLDYRRGAGAPSFASVNFGDLDPAEIKTLAQSFTDAMEAAISGSIDDDNL
jgi:hypothetical protein